MKLTIQQDKKGKWRWTLKAKNGRIIGASTQGYSSLENCRKNIDQVADGLCLHRKSRAEKGQGTTIE